MKNDIKINRLKPPCQKNGLKCEFRKVGCHSKCKEFAVFRAELDSLRDAVQKAKDKEDSYMDYKREKAKRRRPVYTKNNTVR